MKCQTMSTLLVSHLFLLVVTPDLSSADIYPYYHQPVPRSFHNMFNGMNTLWRTDADERESGNLQRKQYTHSILQPRIHHRRQSNRRPKRYPYRSILPDCNPRTCQPPDCTCPSYSHPGDFPLHQVPRIIMLTFDDAIAPWNYAYFERIMSHDFRNPNGCPIRMTFFVCDDDGYNNYTLTSRLYQEGHEIASHSVSHRYPESWWSRAPVNKYREEFVGQRRRLSRWAGIPRRQVRGLRVPFLSINGNSVMQIAKANHFTYDTSCVGSHSPDRHHPPLWPYTLDFVPSEEICEQSSRPTRPFPGVWEVPLTKYRCGNHRGNYMLDECQGHLGKGRPSDVFDFLWDHFAIYNRTRAPMGLFTHATFLRDERGALPGLIEFLRRVTSLENVWIVSVGQVVDWMKAPTPISDLHQFHPWSC